MTHPNRSAQNHPKQYKNWPLASLSLDLDNQWSYMKIHGDKGWEAFPSYLDVVVPRSLKFLRDRNLRITYFIVGKDAALEKNHQALAAIGNSNHEVGNHSFHHESWLHLYSESEIETEIAEAERHIEQVTGKRPRGFRGPGFSFSKNVLKVLARRGYHYDASTFPTYLGPLARAYYFMTAKNLTPEERRKRKALFGGFKDGFQPLKPYRWNIQDGSQDRHDSQDRHNAQDSHRSPDLPQDLVEMPVTTMPIFKVPIHFSYVLYLSVFSPFIALLYFRIALLLCRLTGTQPSLLLHPLDFMGKEDVPELAFFPGMSLTSEKKLQTLGKALDMLRSQFEVLPMGEHVYYIRGTKLPRHEPRQRYNEEALAWRA